MISSLCNKVCNNSIFLLLLFLILPINGHAATKSVEVTTQVAAGTWKTVRLRSLPADAGLRVEATSEESVTIVLTDHAGFISYPQINEPLLFKGQVVKNLSFTARIPHSDNYYILVDNRNGNKEQSVQLHIEASSSFSDIGEPPPQSIPITDIESRLRSFIAQLQKLFVFNAFRFAVQDCQATPPPPSSSHFIVCTDRIKELENLTSDSESADILLFTLLHETAHRLLDQWQYPFADNKEIADEFAVTLMVVLQQERRLENVVQYLQQHKDNARLISGLFADDRHRFVLSSPENLLALRDNREKKQRWLKFLFPHIQPDVMTKIRQQASPNLDSMPLDHLGGELKI